MIYDITNAETFKNCKYWLENIRTYANENVVIALVANKFDIVKQNASKREVPMEAAEKFSRENGLIFVGETSALSNIYIKEVMSELIEKIYTVERESKQGKKSREKFRVTEEGEEGAKSGCCK